MRDEEIRHQLLSFTSTLIEQFIEELNEDEKYRKNCAYTYHRPTEMEDLVAQFMSFCKEV